MKKSIFILFALLSVFQGQAQFENLEESFRFRNIGPTRGGRVTSVTGDPGKSGTFYMGSTGGGLWKTINYGNSWKNISDGYFATGSIGAVRVAQSDHSIIYCGTGSDGIRSNVIPGNGVYKSENGGKTWEHLGLEKTGHIGAVEIHPKNPDIVFVAAIGNAFAKNEQRGLFRTTDGGKNWEKVLYINDSIGIVDFEFSPDNPQEMYASAWQVDRKPWTIQSGPFGGIYKSSDGGDTWNKLKNGLPSGLIGKIDLAVSPANPDKLYALVEALPGSGLYISEDRGETFKFISNEKGLLDRPFYYCNIDVNPENENTIFVNSTRFHRSFDGGKTWHRVRTPHGDNHDMWFHPSDTSIYVQGNDGGANVTLDYGLTWSTQSNQSTAELYQVEVDDQYPYWLYAGQQDNSTISVPSEPPYNPAGGPTAFWTAVGGCETGPAVPKPGDPNIVFSNCKGRFGVFNKKTGQEKQYYVGAANMYGHNPTDLKYRFQRVSPVHASPHNPNIVYHTSQFVHKTTDDGVTWETISPDLTANTPETQVISGAPITRDVTGEEFYSTIYSIQESKAKAGIIWTGANDGPVHVTKDGGKTWSNVTPNELPSGGRIDAVEPSPHQTEKAYFTSLRYQLGDSKPYIYKTTDSGKNWELITKGIPDNHPVRVVREDPANEGVLFAGTEYAIFISLNDGQSWESIQLNMPVTPITDMKFIRNDLAISTMGRGFWILDNVSGLIDVIQHDQQKNFLVKPENTTAFRYYSRSNAVPEYQSPGVDIVYNLKENSSVKIEIFSEDGQLINLFESNHVGGKGQSSTSMSTGFVFTSMGPSPEGNKGLNSYRWNLEHFGAWHKEASRRGLGGPNVSPGKYKVKVTAGDFVEEQTFEVNADPRVLENGTTLKDLKEQEKLGLKVRTLQSEARYLGYLLDEALNGSKKISRRKKERLTNLYDQLFTAEGTYMTPMLIDQIRYLNNMITRADQVPGKDAYMRFEELNSLKNQIMEALEKEINLNLKLINQY